MKRFIYPLLLFLAFLVIVAVPGPEFLRDYLGAGFLIAAVVLVPLHLIFTNKTYSDPELKTSLWTIGLAGVLLTGIFWFRASGGSYGFETGLGLGIARTFLFWMPAVLFACLYRSAGEGWKPGSRRNLLVRLAVAVLAGLAGLGLQDVARNHIDRIPMDHALRHVERQLPAGNSRVGYSLDRKVLHLNVAIDPDFTEPNIRSLRRIHSISAHASHLISRKDTDSLALTISRNGMVLATLNWPDHTTNRTADRVRINYTGTGLSNLPAGTDLAEIFDGIEPVFRPENLAAGLDGSTLILRWTGEDGIPDDPALIPGIVHDWRAVNRTIMHSVFLYEGIDSFRVLMPGYRLEVPADSVKNLFRAQQMIPLPGFAGVIQLYEHEEMPEPPEFAGSAPVRIILGDGVFHTRSNTTGPLWLWERGILAGYHFYMTHLEDDGAIRFVIHPADSPEEARWAIIRPGERKMLFTMHARYLTSPAAGP